ncbi:MAG: DNA polymerase III subunit delta [Muribaculaceae bacterium]|nr:DNA polymerase III subunit delta [Muribaculaceae bacterium]
MIYFFYGDEEFNISNEIKKFKNKLDKNFIEMSYKYYNNLKFPDLVAVLKTQPMMFGKMLIEINCLSYLSGKSTEDKGFDDKQIAQITEALDNCNENLDIIFTAQLPPDSQKKIDKRKKFFKLLSKYNAKEFLQIPSYKTAELESWIKQQAKTKDLKLTDDVASEILIQVGGNLRLLDSELEKLKIFAGKNSVTKNMVKEICVTNEDLFIFADYLIAGNLQKTLEEYQKLLSKKHPLEIMSVLHTLIHSKIQIKALSNGHSQDEIAKIINLHPYRVKLELQKLKNTSLKNLVKLKQNLTNAEYKIKSGQAALDLDKELEFAILQ